MGFGKYLLPNTQTPIYIMREPKTSERIAHQIRVRSGQEEHPRPQSGGTQPPGYNRPRMDGMDCSNENSHRHELGSDAGYSVGCMVFNPRMRTVRAHCSLFLHISLLESF
jgi:hypothetical protein